ncbi:hypothetical protein [Sodalis ligni]|uniref:Uncharacterized protein n=1 Tax=Sodalis ligni TaxID=2697027 RepID=A0A4R1NHZ2_9GAMM|nr:hypothetical protein [Sodalis ligni]TCL07153.1 hypothetical protein EZJ58_5465 [Sodalis ligni]
MPGNPLLDINNLSDVSDAATARVNLDIYDKETLAATDGASLIGFRVKTVMSQLDASQVGTDAAPGYPNALTNIPDNTSDFDYHKWVIPNGNFTLNHLFVMTDEQKTTQYKQVEIRGQGSRSTQITHPAGSASAGDGVQFGLYSINGITVGGMYLNNAPLNRGAQGAFNIENCSDVLIDDLVIDGSGNLSIYTDECSRVFFNNVRVNGQKYFTGNGKASILFGGASEDNFAIGGGASALSTDGSYFYNGDLADNDHAMRAVFMGMYFRGLLASEASNQNACLWAEGQESRCNTHSIGVNTLGHGIGMASTELNIHTSIGGTIQSSQVRGVWNRNIFCSMGKHFFDHMGESGSSTVHAAIHHDGALFTASIGDVFDGNTVPCINDYHASVLPGDASAISVIGSQLTSFRVYGDTHTAQHHTIIGSRQTHASLSSMNQGGARSHGIYIGNSILGPVGQYGSNVTGNYHEFYGITAECGPVYTGAALSVNLAGILRFDKCKFLNYSGGIINASPTNPPQFKECIFVNVSFNSLDAAVMRCIDCVFISCTGTLPISVSADSFTRPGRAKMTVTTTVVDQTVSFPSWVRLTKGLCHIKIEGAGSSATQDYGEYVMAKPNATSVNPTITTLYESTAGFYAPVWPANSASIGAIISTIGTYDIEIW